MLQSKTERHPASDNTTNYIEKQRRQGQTNRKKNAMSWSNKQKEHSKQTRKGEQGRRQITASTTKTIQTQSAYQLAWLCRAPRPHSLPQQPRVRAPPTCEAACRPAASSASPPLQHGKRCQMGTAAQRQNIKTRITRQCDSYGPSNENGQQVARGERTQPLRPIKRKAQDSAKNHLCSDGRTQAERHNAKHSRNEETRQLWPTRMQLWMFGDKQQDNTTRCKRHK